MASDVKYPDVKVRLTGQDGNVYGLIGAVRDRIGAIHGRTKAMEFASECFHADDYDDVMQIIMKTVVVE